MSTTIQFHANDPQPTTVVGQHFPAGPANVAFDTIDIRQGSTTIALFLNREVAAAIVCELEQLYPELRTTPSNEEVDAMANYYADEHAGDSSVPISHTSPADEAIAAALDELAESPNATKFGTLSDHPQCDSIFYSGAKQTRCVLPAGHDNPHYFPASPPSVEAQIFAHNANVISLVEKAMGVR